MAQILVIEDEPTLAMVLQESLEDEGHEVEIATNGLEGLRRLQRPPRPDLVLLDLFMPGMGGRTLLERIHEEEWAHTVPVILVTGAVPRTEDFPPEGTYRAVVTKPFHVDEVIQMVNRFANDVM